jgi:hypothetical protein
METLVKLLDLMNKIFCIGSNKTGTTTLTKMLSILEYNICPEHIMFEQKSKYFEQQLNGEYENLFKLVELYDVFEDRPWNHIDFYKILDEKYPNSKFILTIRDTDNWIESYKRWNKSISLDKTWFYPIISNICYGNTDFLNDEKTMRVKYEQRNYEIIKYFENTNKLLIMDFEKNSGYNELCGFLNKPLIKEKTPHLKKTK